MRKTEEKKMQRVNLRRFLKMGGNYQYMDKYKPLRVALTKQLANVLGAELLYESLCL